LFDASRIDGLMLSRAMPFFTIVVQSSIDRGAMPEVRVTSALAPQRAHLKTHKNSIEQFVNRSTIDQPTIHEQTIPHATCTQKKEVSKDLF
jgi:hypothetical protein